MAELFKQTPLRSVSGQYWWCHIDTEGGILIHCPDLGINLTVTPWPVSSYLWSCLSWFMLGMQVWGDSIGSQESNMLPQHSFALHLSILHTQQMHPSIASEVCLPLLSHNMLVLTLALSMWNHSPIYLSGDGPKSSVDVGFISSWTPFWWPLFWSNYSAEKKERVHMAIFMSWGFISLGRLLGLLCFHCMNQKYISVYLHKSRACCVLHTCPGWCLCGTEVILVWFKHS